MSELVRKVNAFFKTALRSEIETVKAGIILSARQEQIFEMYYIKKQDVGFIADTLGTCENVIKKELNAIRNKLETFNRQNMVKK